MNDNFIMDARALACYIIDKYDEIKKNSDDEISPIKLQKSLYFCFAYWGGLVRKSKEFKNISEIGTIDLPELLFNNKIEAWVYGPVVPIVYHEKNIDKYRIPNKNPFGNAFVKEYIDGVLKDVLSANDFKLVEVSHNDRCWKKHFKPNSPFHNLEIPHEDIIREYASNTTI